MARQEEQQHAQALAAAQAERDQLFKKQVEDWKTAAGAVYGRFLVAQLNNKACTMAPPEQVLPTAPALAESHAKLAAEAVKLQSTRQRLQQLEEELRKLEANKQALLSEHSQRTKQYVLKLTQQLSTFEEP